MGLPFNIAIDGFSSCGKSTIAKRIALEYGMHYVDTGAMYRAITLYCIQHEIIVNGIINIDKLNNSIDNVEISFFFDTNKCLSETILNDENVEDSIRGIEVSENVSLISEIRVVRKKLISIQQDIGKNKNVVMDGRDIGSKVFPDARIKFFIIASPEIRAQRRYQEMISTGYKISFNEVLLNLNKRDKRDLSREMNPLIQPKDAVVIDNSELSIDEQNNFIDKIILNKK